MHIPDHYLSPATCAVMGTAMVGVWAVALKKTSTLDSGRLTSLGMAAAFCFLVMMFNLPLPGGGTGHAVGAVLAAILIGPWAACLAVSTALLFQAFFFGDGGILALGANAFDMAFVMPFSGWLLYRGLSQILQGQAGKLASLGIAAWGGINLGALSTAILFGLQPLLARDAAGNPLYCPYPLSTSLPGIMIPHLLVVGFVEAVFTIAVWRFLSAAAPSMLTGDEPGRKPGFKPSTATILAGVLALASPLGLLAAGTAWGEWDPSGLPVLAGSGTNPGLAGTSTETIPEGMQAGPLFQPLFPDYTLAGMPEWLGYLLSAAGGAAVLIILFRLAAAALGKRRSHAD